MQGGRARGPTHRDHRLASHGCFGAAGTHSGPQLRAVPLPPRRKLPPVASVSTHAARVCWWAATRWKRRPAAKPRLRSGPRRVGSICCAAEIVRESCFCDVLAGAGAARVPWHGAAWECSALQGLQAPAGPPAATIGRTQAIWGARGETALRLLWPWSHRPPDSPCGSAEGYESCAWEAATAEPHSAGNQIPIDIAAGVQCAPGRRSGWAPLDCCANLSSDVLDATVPNTPLPCIDHEATISLPCS